MLTTSATNLQPYSGMRPVHTNALCLQIIIVGDSNVGKTCMVSLARVFCVPFVHPLVYDSHKEMHTARKKCFSCVFGTSQALRNALRHVWWGTLRIYDTEHVLCNYCMYDGVTLSLEAYLNVSVCVVEVYPFAAADSSCMRLFLRCIHRIMRNAEPVCTFLQSTSPSCSVVLTSVRHNHIRCCERVSKCLTRRYVPPSASTSTLSS